MRESIARFPPIPTRGAPDFPIPLAAAVSDRNLEHLWVTPHDGDDRRSCPARLRSPCHSNGRYGHSVQHRAVSLREAAALQSFLDPYRFARWKRMDRDRMEMVVSIKRSDQKNEERHREMQAMLYDMNTRLSRLAGAPGAKDSPTDGSE